jgi:hypothetical protein
MLRVAMWFALGFALFAGSAQAATIAVQVDVSQDRRPIDPAIYGANFGTAAQLADPGFTVRRWGGNATTRYNYQVDVANRGSDFVFLNGADGTGMGLPDASTLNTFVAETLAAGAEPLVTIGTIGYTPINSREKRYGFAVSKYGPQLRNGCSSGFDCDGGNGECDIAQNDSGFCVDVPGLEVDLIVGNDPLDTSFVSGTAWARGMIAHLKSRHGTGANGGVKFYALDNEPMLWNSTHRDVHPAPATYNEIWSRTVEYATAIKAEEPAAKVFGPVTWGYCDLFGSAADNCVLGPDRADHQGLPFVQWYLRQVCDYEEANDVRLVDYLDLHYYPQGSNVVDFFNNVGVSENAENSAKRLRSLKEMYDPAWVAESWMSDLGDGGYQYDRPQILRRVKAWIAEECPDMKLAITEYNWGPDIGESAALAQAELLAIFGREGVDLATRWVAPAEGSLVERAFRLFLDYDGQGSRVVGDSVRAVSANVDALGAYAVDLPGQRTMLLLFNKSTVANTAQITLDSARNGAWQLYRFTAASDVSQVASGNIAGASITVANLPARSANLLVLPAGAVVDDGIFANGFESP